MALCALQRNVRSGQRKSSGGMVKGGAVPRSCVVALLAILRDTRLHVVRSRRVLEILQVATDARSVRGGQVEVPIHVTLSALQRGMRPGQWEARAAVIESGIVPGSCVVALLARGRET